MTASVVREDLLVMPATRAQQRFWAAEQLTPGSTAFNMPLAWRITGQVRKEGIRHAVRALIERQESLRTAFRFQDGQLNQVVHPPFELDLLETDLTRVPSEERQRACQEQIQADSEYLFDPADLPLIAVRLIRLTDQESVLTFTLHHLVCDGWSNGVLLREFGELYDAWSQGVPSTLAPLPLQFCDWAIWQEDRLRKGEFDRSLEYWRQLLTPLPPVPAIPADKPVSWTKAQPGHIESLLLPDSLSASIRQLCQREDLTPYHVLLAAFEILVADYSNTDLFLLGSPFANRNQPELQDIVGLFANPQFVVADLRGLRTFIEVARRVKENTLVAAEHAETPFESVLQALGNGSTPARVRFPVYFIYQRAFMQPASLTEIDITPLRSVSPGAQFDWMVGVVERQEGIRLQVEYNSGAFHLRTIQAMLSAFRGILERAVANPGIALRSLSGKPLTALDARVSSAEFAFETAARQLRWGHLDAEAGRWTRLLSERGVQRGDTVGLAIPLGADLLAATIASWKWGASVACLDPQAAAIPEGVRVVLRCEDVDGLEPMQGWNLASMEGDAIWLPVEGKSPHVLSHRRLASMLVDVAHAASVTPDDLVRVAARAGSPEAVLGMLLPLVTGAGLTDRPDAATVTLTAAEDHTRLSTAKGSAIAIFGLRQFGQAIAAGEPASTPGAGFRGRILPSAEVELINRFGQRAAAGVRAEIVVDGRETGMAAAWTPEGLLAVLDAPRRTAASGEAAELPPSDDERPPDHREEELRRVLIGVWKDVLRQPEIGIDDDFFSLGGSSLAALRVVTQLSELMGRDVKLSALATNRTVRRLASCLSESEGNQPAQTIVALQSSGSGTPIFCIYGVFLYFPLAEEFRGERPVYGVYLPEEFDLIRRGLNIEQSVLASVPEQAAQYVQIIRAKQPHGPYHLAGESFGGVVALEIARQLQEQGEQVGIVALLDSYAPGFVHRKQGLARAAIHAKRVLSGGISYLQEKAQARLKTRSSSVAEPGEQGIEELRQQARRIAMRRYSPPTPYDGEVAMFRATDRDPFEVDDRESLWGWRRFLAGRVTVHEVDGDHLTILQPPNVSSLASVLRERLLQSEA
jgi:thioesterase domain-containing protein